MHIAHLGNLINLAIVLHLIFWLYLAIVVFSLRVCVSSGKFLKQSPFKRV
jgi:hypothetical protein